MELKLHSDDDGFKSAELVSATIPLKNGIIRIQREEGLENEQLMITSNNSKLFRRMWIYPLTSDAIVVEIK